MYTLQNGQLLYQYEDTENVCSHHIEFIQLRETRYFSSGGCATIVATPFETMGFSLNGTNSIRCKHAFLILCFKLI